MNYLSLFSGIEAAHLAWSPLGWRCAGVAEIDHAACAVLRHQLPHVPNLGNVTEITDAQIEALGPINIVIGGSPCQDLSIAGKRAGLAGARSKLFHEQLRIFDAARHFCGARWLVWENVPGALSSNQGRDFAAMVGAMAGCELAAPADGWSKEGVALGDHGLVEWSVLDAQWFGVAQRRRRVFAVLDTGDWTSRPPVLLEPDRLRGDSAPRREASQSVASKLACRVDRGSSKDERNNMMVGTLQASGCGPIDVATCLNASASVVQEVAHTLRADGFDASEDGTGRGTPIIPVTASSSLIAFDCKASGQAGFGIGAIASTMRSMGHAESQQNGGGHLAVLQGMQVRRITPIECERLQGFPDGWTRVPNARGKPMADGQRYKMLGNSFAVPVIKWIGQSIQRSGTCVKQDSCTGRLQKWSVA